MTYTWIARAWCFVAFDNDKTAVYRKSHAAQLRGQVVAPRHEQCVLDCRTTRDSVAISKSLSLRGVSFPSNELVDTPAAHHRAHQRFTGFGLSEREDG